MIRNVTVKSYFYFIVLSQLNHKMTKALEGPGVEVEIRMRYVEKLGHGLRVHLNMFLSHHYLTL